MTTATTSGRPAAALWDMDGTIIDSEPLWIAAEMAMLERYGLAFPPGTETQLVGLGLTAAAERFQQIGVPLSVDEIIAEWSRALVAGLATDAPRWMPGALELLAEFRELGVPNVLVTMSVRPIADAVVALLPEGTFAAVVAGDEVAHEKPHPDPYRRGAAAVGAAAPDCIAFEDSRPGVTSAIAAGAVVVATPGIVPLEAGLAHDTRTTLQGLDAAGASALWARHRTHSTEENTVTTHEHPAAEAPDTAAPAAAAVATPALRGPFQLGDRVQLTGPKGRMNTITLEAGGEFHSHKGMIRHDDIVGVPDASVIANSNGEEYLALRPLLSDFVMSMPRGAAIVYPKDAAQIISLADIFPGARVVEAGVGSGALSLHLLRAVGPEGEVHSFERREEFADIARANARAYAGEDPANWTVRVGDLQEALPSALESGSVDRVVLDMLAPWECVGVTAEALAPGGVVICYVATVTQLSRTVEEFRRSGLFTHPQASETMVRGWHVEGLAVRPDHRMVGHTGFLVTARKLAPGTNLPSLKRRASKSDFTDADMASWLPDMGADGDPGAWSEENVGQLVKSDKILRKKAREAKRIADHRVGTSEGVTDTADAAEAAETAPDERSQ
ncbi:HAD superfamily hydrolase (TIGR01509 family) [Leucobacter aridicollis]|uniref:HAD superfamily hydrolase (TIGR01509 family) n=1 Tax=Leucobacter aridicollis TaxID=283878 RepID=A0A852QZ78_9MICO|nr:HAD superfamily hydrolase (TIGR01509 family) [Leucobacter aridicollis]